jgi:hypothetical protein
MKGKKPMVGKVVLGALSMFAAYMVLTSIPDMVRYVRIKTM